MDVQPHSHDTESEEPRAGVRRVPRLRCRAEGWRVRIEDIERLDALFPLNKEDPVVSLRTELAVLHHAFRFYAVFAVYIPGMDATQDVAGRLTALTTDPAREHRELCVRLEYDQLPEDLRWRLSSASRRKNDCSSVWVPLPYIHHGLIEILDQEAGGEPRVLYFYDVTGGKLRFPEAAR